MPAAWKRSVRATSTAPKRLVDRAKRHSDLRGRRRPAGQARQCALKRWRPAARLVSGGRYSLRRVRRVNRTKLNCCIAGFRLCNCQSGSTPAKSVVSSIKHIKVIFDTICGHLIVCSGGFLAPQNESRLRGGEPLDPMPTEDPRIREADVVGTSGSGRDLVALNSRPP